MGLDVRQASFAAEYLEASHLGRFDEPDRSDMTGIPAQPRSS